MNRIEIKKGGAKGHLSVVPHGFKAVADQPGMIEGYGSVFSNEDYYGDIVAPGAFTQSLMDWKQRGRLPNMLWQHDPGVPIGVWKEMRQDDIGLYCVGQLLLKVQAGQEAYEYALAGAVDGLSIGFETIERTWNSETETRTLTIIDLWEVSMATFPANDLARIDGVKAANSIKTIREFENWLRDEGGFSHDRAKAIASHGFKAAPNSRDENGGLSDVLGALRDVRNNLNSQP